MLTHRHLKYQLENLGLRVVKTRNTRGNVGKTAEYTLWELFELEAKENGS